MGAGLYFADYPRVSLKYTNESQCGIRYLCALQIINEEGFLRFHVLLLEKLKIWWNSTSTYRHLLQLTIAVTE